MGVTLTDVLLFAKAQPSDLDNASFVIYRRNILRWAAVGSALDVIVGPAPAPLSLPDAVVNSLSYVKAFGGTKQTNIPDIYTQVNYVTNTAQTMVNTGIMIDFAKNYEFEVECAAVSGSWYILQSRETSTSNITGISGSNSGSTITLVCGNVTACTSAITRIWGHKLYVKATLNSGVATLYVKDETSGLEDTQTGSYGVSQPNPPTPVYLLGNAGGNAIAINSDIYMARIKEDGVTVMDYVPARQGVTAGFYDKASGTFKVAETPANLSADGNTVPTPDAPMDIVCNNGTLKTRHTSGLPLEYEQVEYLESSGGQYLDTGVILKGETLEVDCDFAFATVPDVDSVPRVIWGFMGPGALPRAALFGYQGKFSYGSNGTNSLAIFIDTNKHSSVFYASANGSSCSFMFDGYGYTGGGSPQTYTSNDLSIYLFARNNDTTGVGNWSVSRIYSGMKFKLDNVVVRDYITCRRLSDNALGMYDLVNKTFITNLGTGTFTAGSTVADPVEVYVDGVVETIRAGSKNLFDAVTAGQVGSGYLSINWTVGADGLNTISGTSTGAGGRNSNKTGTFTLGAGTYTVSFSGTKDINLVLVNETTNTDIVSGLTGGTFTLTEPTPLHFGIAATNGTTYDSSFYTQIEYGSTATSYTPYYDGGTATCENLLSIGDYTDVQEILSGDITRKVAVKVLDGTESWTWSSSGFVYLPITDAALATDINKDIICTHLSCTSTAWASGTGIRWNAVGTNIILAKKSDVSSANDWKQWLADQYAAGTPVIIVYPLATATTESVAGQTLNITSGDNVIDITQASISGLELEAKYKKVS